VHLIFDTWPEAIAKPLSEQVVEVLTIPRGGLLTVSVLAAAYFASNGVEALRASLNRAYRVPETRPWYVTRLVSLGFVIGAVIALAAISAPMSQSTRVSSTPGMTSRMRRWPAGRPRWKTTRPKTSTASVP
jgi:uncharacterized BrkB/YihY/UPF0761 family membrane protein